MGLIQRLFGLGQGILCPNCEKPIEGHDDSACRRRMSRRYFFGALGGGIVTAVVAPAIIGDTLEQPYIEVVHHLGSTDYGFLYQIEKIRPRLPQIFMSNPIFESSPISKQYFRIPLKTEAKYNWFDKCP